MDRPPPTATEPERFVDDVRATAAAIGAPFSEPVTRRMLDVFGEGFSTGGVLWKATSRPGDALSYRFYSRRRTDTLQIASQAGLIAPASPLGSAVAACSALDAGAPVQSCDFDANGGLAKSWVFLGRTIPLAEVLAAPGIPRAVRDLAPVLHDHGLDYVRYTAVDYRHETVNLYFRVRGPFSAEHAVRICSLAGAAPAARPLVDEIGAFLPKGDYVAAVTVAAGDGTVERVALYATGLAEGTLPPVGDRLTRFLAAAPSYDPSPVTVVAWSFGPSGPYIKAERSWYGNVAALFRRADVLVSGSDRADAALGG